MRELRLGAGLASGPVPQAPFFSRVLRSCAFHGFDSIRILLCGGELPNMQATPQEL